MTDDNITEKKKFNFAEYYKTHPEFKARHLKKMMEKMNCPICNKDVRKGNISLHNKSSKHMNLATIQEQEHKIKILHEMINNKK